MPNSISKKKKKKKGNRYPRGDSATIGVRIDAWRRRLRFVEGAEWGERGRRATQAPNRWEWSRWKRSGNAIEYPLPWRRSTDPEQAILCLPRARTTTVEPRFTVPYTFPVYTHRRVYIYIHINARDSPFLSLSLSAFVCVYLRVEIYACYIYACINGRMAWVEGGERDGNASDEIRGTRVPRVTQGQLDSRPFKRDYVQRPSSLVLSLSLSLFLSFFVCA